MVFSTSRAAFVAAGIHVDGDQRLGFVDDDVAAAGQPDLAMKGIVDLLLDVVALEDRLRVRCNDGCGPWSATRSGPTRSIIRLHASPSSQRTSSISSVRKSRTVRSMRSGSSKTQAGRRLFLHRLLDGSPLFDEQAEVADEVTGALAFADRAHDHAHALGNVEFLENLAQAFALLGDLDLARDAALVAVRHEHEVAAGQARYWS